MAKYYIYRNLSRGGYSVKYRGKVVDHIDAFMATDCVLKVNERSRQRVLNERKNYVHAYIVCESYEPWHFVAWGDKITYNPFKAGYFYKKNTGEPIHHAKRIFGDWGHIVATNE
jgi:hypothetical protein